MRLMEGSAEDEPDGTYSDQQFGAMCESTLAELRVVFREILNPNPAHLRRRRPHKYLAVYRR